MPPLSIPLHLRDVVRENCAIEPDVCKRPHRLVDVKVPLIDERLVERRDDTLDVPEVNEYGLIARSSNGSPSHHC